jgi:hypothetical protein
MAEKVESRVGWKTLVVVFLALGFTWSLVRGDKSAPKAAPVAQAQVAPKTAAMPEPKRDPVRCALKIAGMPAQQVLLFPTEEGLDEFSKAARSGDERAQTIAMSENAGFTVDPGTDCTWLDVGIAQTKVRVLAGKHAGKAGWAPTEWTREP